MRGFKADIANRGQAQMEEMSRRWLAVERRLQGNIDALAMQMTAVRDAGGVVTPNMLLNETRYRELLIQLQEEQAKYTVYANRTITQGQSALASAGVRQSQAAIAAQISTSFNKLPVSAVQHMAGLTGAGTPLHSLLVQSWPLSAQGLTQALVDGVALGYGPRKTAKMMAEGMTRTLDRMLTIARTEQLRVHRESSLATYKASGVVTGYRRLCAHDRRSCAACIMDEGHVYTLDEEMPEHPNGRCAMIPVVAGAPPIDWLKGEEWFVQQDAAVQADILGKGHYSAWKDGQFALQDLVTVKPNVTWGPSLQVTPLNQLAGQAARAPIVPPPAAPPPGQFTSIEQARNYFDANGMIVRHNPEDVLAVRAQQVEADFVRQRAIFDRQRYLNNWTDILAGTGVSDEVALPIYNSIAKALDKGTIDTSIPFLIRNQSRKINEKFIVGQYMREGQFVEMYADELARITIVHKPLFTDVGLVAEAYDDYVEGIVVHEFGHHYTITQHPGISRRAQGVIQDIDDDKTVRKWVKQNISYYATANDSELAAEAYTMTRHPDWDQAPTDVRAFIERVMGDE